MTKREIVIEAYYNDPQFSRTKLSKKHDIEPAYIRKVVRSLQKSEIKQGHKPLEETIEFNRTSTNHAKLDLQSLTVTTLKQALAVAKVDLTQWKVDRYQIGSWQVTLKVDKDTGRLDEDGNPIYKKVPKTVTMYKIQVWLKKLHNMEWVEAIKLLIEEVPKLKTPKKKYNLNGDYLLEISLMDIHFGMLAWDKEVGQDYDLEIAENIYLNAVGDLLNKAAGYRPSRILFPFGNDFLHINDATNATPGNRNPLDTDSRLIKIYQKGKMAVIKAINHCREVAPVDVLWIPGNHDPDISYFMCDVIDEIFAKDEDVQVDKSPKSRKFYPWGNGLVIFAHGMPEPLTELPNLAATEQPKLWGNAKYREVHVGHKHTKREMRWMSIRHSPGAVVRLIPSLCATDAWHYKHGYVRQIHAAEAYLWDKKDGVIGQFMTHVRY